MTHARSHSSLRNQDRAGRRTRRMEIEVRWRERPPMGVAGLVGLIVGFAGIIAALGGWW